MSYDLNISSNNFSIDCRASRWDTDNYSIIVETWMNKSNYETLRDNLKPGAVGELYTILGRPHYYDGTWEANNTITLTSSSNEQLYNMRREKTMFVKNLSSSPEKGASGWINVKIEGLISGMGFL